MKSPSAALPHHGDGVAHANVPGRVRADAATAAHGDAGAIPHPGEMADAPFAGELAHALATKDRPGQAAPGTSPIDPKADAVTSTSAGANEEANPDAQAHAAAVAKKLTLPRGPAGSIAGASARPALGAPLVPVPRGQRPTADRAARHATPARVAPQPMISRDESSPDATSDEIGAPAARASGPTHPDQDAAVAARARPSAHTAVTDAAPTPTLSIAPTIVARPARRSDTLPLPSAARLGARHPHYVARSYASSSPEALRADAPERRVAAASKVSAQAKASETAARSFVATGAEPGQKIPDQTIARDGSPRHGAISKEPAANRRAGRSAAASPGVAAPAVATAPGVVAAVVVAGSPSLGHPAPARHAALARRGATTVARVAEQNAPVRASASGHRTDLRAQASPSAKAPPEVRREVVEKNIGAPVVADKSDSRARVGTSSAATPDEAPDAVSDTGRETELAADVESRVARPLAGPPPAATPTPVPAGAQGIRSATLVGHGPAPGPAHVAPAIAHRPAFLGTGHPAAPLAGASTATGVRPGAHAHAQAHAHAHAAAHAHAPSRSDGKPSARPADPATLVPGASALASAIPPVPGDPSALVPTSAPHDPAPAAHQAAALLASLGSAFANLDPSLFALAVPPPMPPAPSSLLAQAAEDASLRATILPERAVLSVDTGAAGELALHLRVKDGVADVRVSGPAAETLDLRAQDLRAALASEGLSLGTFESGRSPSREPDVDPSDRGSDARPTGHAVSAVAASSTPSTDTRDSTAAAHALGARGLHVTA